MEIVNLKNISDKKYREVQLPLKFLLSLNNGSIGYSKVSINHYAEVIKYFITYLEKRFNMPVDITLATIDGIVISEYLKVLKDKGLTETTIRNREAIIKKFITWLTTEEVENV